MTVNTDANVILMIGGVSSENNFATQLLEYDLSSQRWKEFMANHFEKYATKRLKLYGHSTVYHSHSNTFYIYGGISYLDDGQLKMSSNLFSLFYVNNDANIYVHEFWQYSKINGLSRL